MPTRSPPGACLFGAPPDTGNLGVSALFLATMRAFVRRIPSLRVTVFDHGFGRRDGGIPVEGANAGYVRIGARDSLRLYRGDSVWTMRIAARLGGLGNLGVKEVRRANAVFDLSAGDSFTDLYGSRRFRFVLAPKLLALDLGAPLVLLPQTYGPFESPRARDLAGRVVRRSALAWARDARSYGALRDLLGPSFDPRRHRLGVDVAMRLDPSAPPASLPERVRSWILRPRTRETIGVNPSGLLLSSPDEARRRYGLRADVRALLVRFLGRLLRETDARILLVPHVFPPPESDSEAARSIRRELGPTARERVEALDGPYGPDEAKALVARLDWFVGARMHSTIAALSSGVPAAGLAYSPKLAGVFESVGQGRRVVDLKALDEPAAHEALWEAWSERERTRGELERDLPPALATADRVFDECARFLETGAIPEGSPASAHGPARLAGGV